MDFICAIKCPSYFLHCLLQVCCAKDTIYCTSVLYQCIQYADSVLAIYMSLMPSVLCVLSKIMMFADEVAYTVVTATKDCTLQLTYFNSSYLAILHSTKI